MSISIDISTEEGYRQWEEYVREQIKKENATITRELTDVYISNRKMVVIKSRIECVR